MNVPYFSLFNPAASVATVDPQSTDPAVATLQIADEPVSFIAFAACGSVRRFGFRLLSWLRLFRPNSPLAEERKANFKLHPADLNS